jgi:nitric oxide reductase NorD protein
MTNQPYSADEIEIRLNAVLDSELNRLTLDKPAATIASLTRTQQDNAIHWIIRAGNAHTEIGYKVSQKITDAITVMNDEILHLWIIRAMEKLDTEGLIPAVQSLDDIEQFAKIALERERGVTFDDVSGMLSLFLQGLSGRDLKLQQYNHAWTDTETVYLPEYVGRFASHDDNFRLYKSILAHQWAQLWYGTWHVTCKPQSQPELKLFSINEIQTYFASPEQVQQATACLQALETIRLDSCIARDLPGIHRDMQHVLHLLNEKLIPSDWEDEIAILKQKEACILDSCRLLPLIMQKSPPARLCFTGEWKLEALQSTLQRRLEKEKTDFQKAVWKMAETTEEDDENDQARKSKTLELDNEDAILTITPEEEEEQVTRPQDIEITIDDEAITVDSKIQIALNSIIQDFGEIPEDYLQDGFAGAYDPNEDSSDKKDPWSGTYHEEGAFIYSEWDHQRQHYRKDWCVLRELDVTPGKLSFVSETLTKYKKLVKHLHKSFEALRSEDKLLKQQSNGNDIDIEAYVEAWVDSQCGMEMTDRLYTRMQRVERSIAVMFMVDLSGSTNGWINEAERESLILLCEALETLGDRYAIYGFSGWARKRCEIFKIKTFSEPYNDEVKAKIAGITPHDYTRMGVAIRHLSMLLNEVDAKTRILITLSDGRPEDYDEYRGSYGIEDTRMALLEARRTGIHPFCITIDKQGLEYLPHMYGPANYVVIDEVAKLPLKVADIYKKLTS